MEAARMHGLSLEVRLAVESDSEVAAVYSFNFALPKERSMGDVRAQFDRPLDRALSMRAADTSSGGGRWGVALFKREGQAARA